MNLNNDDIINLIESSDKKRLFNPIEILTRGIEKEAIKIHNEEALKIKNLKKIWNNDEREALVFFINIICRFFTIDKYITTEHIPFELSINENPKEAFESRGYNLLNQKTSEILKTNYNEFTRIEFSVSWLEGVFAQGTIYLK